MNALGLKSLLALSMLVGATHVESARGDDMSAAYLGGNFGRAHNAYDTGYIDQQIDTAATGAGDTVKFTDTSTQKMSDAWWVDAGYFFSPYIGIDGAFLHVGEIKYVAVGSVLSTGTSEHMSTWNEINSHGPALSLVLRMPIVEFFEADLRVGDYYGKATWDNELTFGSNSAFTRQSKSDSSLLAGVGCAYTFAGHWSIRLDYLRINQTGNSYVTGKFSVNLATAGVSFTF